MALEMPVSSSRLRKTKPLAVPGRCRAITDPATRTLAPSANGAGRQRRECPLALIAGDDSHRMRADRHSRIAKIGDESLFHGHRLQRRMFRIRYVRCFFRLFTGFQKRPGTARDALDLPESIAPVETGFAPTKFKAPISASAVSSDFCSAGTRSFKSSIERNARIAAGRQFRASFLAQAFHVAQAQAHGKACRHSFPACRASPNGSHRWAERAGHAAAHPSPAWRGDKNPSADCSASPR